MKLQRNQLKEIIKPLVKEVILEVFAEMHLERIISNSLDESLKRVNFAPPQQTIREQRQPQRQTQPQRQPVAKPSKTQEELLEYRRKMLDSLHYEDGKPLPPGQKPQPKVKTQVVQAVPKKQDMLHELLEDTAASGFEIGAEESNVNPELVSESTLDDLGLFDKDFSKFDI